MTIDMSMINGLSNLNLINQTINATSGSGTLNNLLSLLSGSSALSSGTDTTQQSVNLTSLSLMTAAGALTSGNPNTVFTGASTQDATEIENAVNSFVSSFNNTVDSLSGSSSAISQQSALKLTSLAQSNASALAAIGVGIDDDGKLIVDSAELQNAAGNNPSAIQSAFNGSSSFALSVSSISRSDISQTLGLSSGAGFMAMYAKSISSGLGTLLSSGVGLVSGYL